MKQQSIAFAIDEPLVLHDLRDKAHRYALELVGSELEVEVECGDALGKVERLPIGTSSRGIAEACHTPISRAVRSCVARLNDIHIALRSPCMSVKTISNENWGAPVSTIVLKTPPASTMLAR